MSVSNPQQKIQTWISSHEFRVKGKEDDDAEESSTNAADDPELAVAKAASLETFGQRSRSANNKHNDDDDDGDAAAPPPPVAAKKRKRVGPRDCIAFLSLSQEDLQFSLLIRLDDENHDVLVICDPQWLPMMVSTQSAKLADAVERLNIGLSAVPVETIETFMSMLRQAIFGDNIVEKLRRTFSDGAIADRSIHVNRTTKCTDILFPDLARSSIEVPVPLTDPRFPLSPQKVQQSIETWVQSLGAPINVTCQLYKHQTEVVFMFDSVARITVSCDDKWRAFSMATYHEALRPISDALVDKMTKIRFDPLRCLAHIVSLRIAEERQILAAQQHQQQQQRPPESTTPTPTTLAPTEPSV